MNVQPFESAVTTYMVNRLPLVDNYPFSWYKVMREQAPVYYDETLGAWSLFRYDDALMAFTDYATFSSRVLHEESAAFETLVTVDPPVHRQLRGLVSQAFTPRRIAALAPRVQQITHHLLDRVLARGDGVVDIAQDIAYPLPATVISELLGVPEEDRPFLKEHLDATSQKRDEKQAEFGAIPTVFHAYFVQAAEARRHQPKDDLLSALVQAQAEGAHLDNDGIAQLSTLLYTAGHVTTTHLISNSFLCFEDFPAARAQVREEPELLPNAIEEVLRYCSSVQAFPRRLTKDLPLRGQSLHAGDLVLIWNGSANHDEQAFPDAEAFRIHRSPNRHLAFGNGIHFCLGAPLARMETPIVIRAILERLPNLERIGEANFAPIGPLITFGPKNLHMSYHQ